MLLEELRMPREIMEKETTIGDGNTKYGKFTAEPYESGYGHTIGNSLRRILLSSLEGSAVTAVRIEGAVHEYSALPGVREDVITILLNLKKLRVQVNNTNRDYIYLSADKEGAVTAKSIQETDSVKVINKDLVIAHIEPGSKLEAEIEISKGRGYVSAEEIAKIPRPAGFIPVDALFSPVTKVHYDVEPARVGQKTDYDRLILEITTDGTIEPKTALEKSADLLRKSLGIFIPESEKTQEPVMQEEPAGEETVSLDDKLDQSLEMLELSLRSLNSLKAEKIRTVRDLVRKTEDELRDIKNLGNKSLTEIEDRLGRLGLSIGMDV